MASRVRTVRKKIYPSVEIELDGPEVQSPYQQIPGEVQPETVIDPKLLKVGSSLLYNMS